MPSPGCYLVRLASADDLLDQRALQRCRVRLTFAYEGNIYRVLRAKPRDKTACLSSSLPVFRLVILILKQSNQPGAWKPLTERSCAKRRP